VFHDAEEVSNRKGLFHCLKVESSRLSVLADALAHFFIACLGRGDEQAAITESLGASQGKIALAGTRPTTNEDYLSGLHVKTPCEFATRHFFLPPWRTGKRRN
jgi:hypothetical protein